MEIGNIQVPPKAEAILDNLNRKGFEAYFVGGCVRDALMGIVPHDWDIATSANPEEVKSLFNDEKVVGYGESHGTVVILKDGELFEITTFRLDGQYSDGRRPDWVEFSKSLIDDLARRDFTINAIAYGKEGIVDHFQGIKDLKQGIIKAVGDPDDRFREDGLRIMRAIRFAARLDFSIESETKEAIYRNLYMLDKVSRERISTELTKFLETVSDKSLLMDSLLILGQFIPELLDMKGFEQKNKHHIYDIWEHTVEVVLATPKNKVLRLAALLHDIGKPKTFFLGEDGQGHFYGHSKESVAMTKNILRRLKYDNKTVDKVAELIRYHDGPIEYTEKAVNRKLNQLGLEGFRNLMALKKADNIGQNPEYRYRIEEYDRLIELAEKLVADDRQINLRTIKLGGKDLVDMGFEGPIIGELLGYSLEAVMDKKVENNKESILKYLRNTGKL